VAVRLSGLSKSGAPTPTHLAIVLHAAPVSLPLTLPPLPCMSFGTVRGPLAIPHVPTALPSQVHATAPKTGALAAVKGRVVPVVVAAPAPGPTPAVRPVLVVTAVVPVGAVIIDTTALTLLLRLILLHLLLAAGVASTSP
jgi:hypothetical protein